jgi:endonuclease V-like protein UPF0215 family
LIGVVFSGLRLDGVLRSRVRRDGANASRVIAELVTGCRFRRHLQAVLLQGIAVAGFNVVDLRWLRAELGLPVIVAMRRRPDLDAIREALLTKVPGGRRKWRLIERAGPVEAAGGVFIQRAGISHEAAAELVVRLAVNSRVPEPLRTAHMIASALGPVPSSQRV